MTLLKSDLFLQFSILICRTLTWLQLAYHLVFQYRVFFSFSKEILVQRFSFSIEIFFLCFSIIHKQHFIQGNILCVYTDLPIFTILHPWPTSNTLLFLNLNTFLLGYFYFQMSQTTRYTAQSSAQFEDISYSLPFRYTLVLVSTFSWSVPKCQVTPSQTSLCFFVHSLVCSKETLLCGQM